MRCQARAVSLAGVAAIATATAACGYPPLPDPDDIQPSGPRSCATLADTCGPTGNDSCCTSPQVTGGMYFRSYDVAVDGAFNNPAFPATVSEFRLDRYEVTVGRFRAFLTAGGGTQSGPPKPGDGVHPGFPGSGWDPNWNTWLPSQGNVTTMLQCSPQAQTWTEMPSANENRPMNCLSWYDAMAFCAWDSGYLPTEAEWNFAAAGGVQQRAYPWSVPARDVTLDSLHASYNDGTDCVGDNRPGCGLYDLVNVGSKPLGDGLYGQADLGGNVSEWMLDWYSSYAPTCDNCANLIAATFRSVRGGSYQDPAGIQRLAYRDRDVPLTRAPLHGARCARRM